MTIERVLLPLTILVLFSAPAKVASQSEWQLFKEKDSIQVYFRQAPDSHMREVKILAWFQASLSSVVTLINDVENFGKWQDHSREVRKLEGHSPTDYIFYNLANFPWPLTDREFVMRATMKQDPVTYTVIFRSEAIPDYLPLNDQYIRVSETISQWKIRPLKKDYLELEYYLRSDPGGSIPAWMVNLALQSGPFNVMKKLKELAQSRQYRQVKLAYIKEPSFPFLTAE